MSGSFVSTPGGVGGVERSRLEQKYHEHIPPENVRVIYRTGALSVGFRRR